MKNEVSSCLSYNPHTDFIQLVRIYWSVGTQLRAGEQVTLAICLSRRTNTTAALDKGDFKVAQADEHSEQKHTEALARQLHPMGYEVSEATWSSCSERSYL